MTAPTVAPQVYTIPEVATILNTTRQNIYLLIRTERLPAFKIASEWRITRSTIDAILAGKISLDTTGNPAAKEIYDKADRDTAPQLLF